MCFLMYIYTKLWPLALCQTQNDKQKNKKSCSHHCCNFTSFQDSHYWQFDEHLCMFFSFTNTHKDVLIIISLFFSFQGLYPCLFVASFLKFTTSRLLNNNGNIWYLFLTWMRFSLVIHPFCRISVIISNLYFLCQEYFLSSVCQHKCQKYFGYCQKTFCRLFLWLCFFSLLINNIINKTFFLLLYYLVFMR